MDSTELVKQETRFSLESLHDFAKWKLIVASGLAAAGLRLTSQQGTAWLLLLIPYACAYVDLYCYQDLIRIIVVSRFFQEHNDATLRAYEEMCQRLHARYRVWDLGHHAQIGGSLVLSLAPIITCIELFRAREWWWLGVALVFWMGGVCLSVGLWRYYKRKLQAASKDPIEDKAQQAAAGD